jgi:tRNA-dihydrouridine synthase B
MAQIAAADAESAARAVAIVSDMGFDGVDLNMGCSVRRIATGEMGSALAKDVERVRAVLTAMVKASPLPVTAKMRSGPDEKHETAPALAKLCEECGCAAVAVHARSAAQAYRGEADWPVIARTKAAVTIPVIGSGSVRSAQDAVRMLRETGCDAVFIARGAMGNPWIFRQAAHILAAGSTPPRPPTADVRKVMLRHYELLLREKGRRYANMLFRKQTSYYAKYAPHPGELRHAVHTAGNDEDLSRVIRQLVV